jgi:hypothetical protein
METANFGLFVANRNGKWKFVFLGRQKINCIINCGLSKRAHLCVTDNSTCSPATVVLAQADQAQLMQ